MSREFSEEVNDALVSSHTSEVFLVLIVIDHADLASPLYLVNNMESITSSISGSSQVYTPIAFNYTPPQNKDGEVNNARVSIDNIDRSIVQTIRSITSSPTLTISTIMASDPDTAVQGPWEFYLANVTFNKSMVSADLIYRAYLDEIVGTVFFTPASFPGLFI